ncbi:UTP--glucose-1-phosphate uridylyltransferase GalU [Mycoplasma sp. P36-A1]|uniref:UTP--glucose-1-phosphate uridylyltransferase GalU n=1 Tax=Mycoplasma sp. P36-A1 TaxID=3252900 RepID=UPI003C2CF561
MINKKVRKAVIPAAGLGTRFLPATKAQAKEMLPIVDIPTIQLIVEEATKSGIEQILIVINDDKQAIENHFDYNLELEEKLRQSGKTDLIKIIRDIADMAEIYYVRQKEQKGLGHAIYTAKDFIAGEPFAVLLGDDVVYSEDKPALKQLIDAYDETNSSIMGVQTVDKAEVEKYGIVSISGDIKDNNRLHQMNGMVEKPNKDQAPSQMAVLGRYILTSEIFDILENQKPGKGNEIQLTDAVATLMETQKVYAYDFEGTRYDVGDKFGFVKATIDYALRRDELKDKVLEYIKQIAK